MYRYNSKMELKLNGSRRHGQWEWHDENCQIEDYGIRWADGKPHREIWCATHGQWAVETPIKVSYIFNDGTTIDKEIK